MNQPANRARLVALLLICFLAVLIVVFFTTDSLRDLNSIRADVDHIVSFTGGHRTVAAMVFFVTYLLSAIIALPITLFLTLLGGALFGLIEGTLLSWLACSIGATLSFLIARYILGDSLIERMKFQLRLARNSFEQDGLFYLFTIRLIPGFPFILANFLAALLPVRMLSFFLVTLAGTLPLTIVYTNAGYRLGEIRSLDGILQAPLIISLIAVGVAPLVVKKLLELIRRTKTTDIS